MRYLAIDPGLDTGWALMNERGITLACGVTADLRMKAFTDQAIRLDSVCIECPQVYRTARSKGDPNSLIVLAVQVGRYAERFDIPKSRLFLPHEWKGTIDKDVHHRRILAELPDDERARVRACLASTPEGKKHNALDAIGLGKWATRWHKW